MSDHFTGGGSTPAYDEAWAENLLAVMSQLAEITDEDDAVRTHALALHSAAPDPELGSKLRDLLRGDVSPAAMAEWLEPRVVRRAGKKPAAKSGEGGESAEERFWFASQTLLFLPGHADEWWQLTDGGVEVPPSGTAEHPVWLPISAAGAARHALGTGHVKGARSKMERLERMCMPAAAYEAARSSRSAPLRSINLTDGTPLQGRAYLDGVIGIGAALPGGGAVYEVRDLSRDERWLSVVKRPIPERLRWLLEHGDMTLLPDADPYDYLGEDDLPPRFRALLAAEAAAAAAKHAPEEIRADEDRLIDETLAICQQYYCWYGAAMMGNPLQRLWMRFDAGRSGKGMSAEMTRTLVGADLVASPDGNHMLGKFRGGEYAQQAVMILDEFDLSWKKTGSAAAEDRARRLSFVKAAVGATPVTAEFKFGRTVELGEFDMPVLMMGNKTGVLPGEGEVDAWEARLRGTVLPTPPPLSERGIQPIPNLGRSIAEAEAPEIITLCCYMYARAVRAGEMPTSASGEKLLGRALHGTMADFADLYEAAPPDERIPNKTIKAHLAEHLRDGGDIAEDEDPSQRQMTAAIGALVHRYGAVRRNASRATGGHKSIAGVRRRGGGRDEGRL